MATKRKSGTRAKSENRAEQFELTPLERFMERFLIGLCLAVMLGFWLKIVFL